MVFKTRRLDFALFAAQSRTYAFSRKGRRRRGEGTSTLPQFGIHKKIDRGVFLCRSAKLGTEFFENGNFCPGFCSDKGLKCDYGASHFFGSQSDFGMWLGSSYNKGCGKVM